MDDRRQSILAYAILPYAILPYERVVRRGSEAAPIDVDVRRDDVQRDDHVARAEALIADTLHRAPEAIDVTGDAASTRSRGLRAETHDRCARQRQGFDQVQGFDRVESLPLPP